MNWLGRRNWAEAEKAAAAQLAKDPADDSAAANLAEALRRQARFDEALAVCTAALERRPSPRLYFSLAVVQLELRQHEAAGLSLAAATTGGADDADSVFIASQVAAVLGQKEAALAAAHRAVILAPHEPRFLAHLGSLLIESDALLAEQRLRQSLKLDPEQAEVHNNLGAALLEQKKSDEAYEAFKAALELAPDYRLAATNLWGLDVARRRKSLSFPLVMVPLLGASWLAWTSVSFGREPQINWARMGASVALMLFGFSVGAITDRMRPREGLSQKIHEDMNAGRLGHQSAVPVLRFFSHFLLGFGLIMMIGCAIAGAFVTWNYLQSGSSTALLGMGLLLAGIIGGGVLIYESRNLKRQAAELRANRS